MRMAGEPDAFIIINGPEDGTEFLVRRSPLTIGTDASCLVNIRLDKTLHAEHARATVVSDGYRIRSKGGKVLVNGRRAGLVRSRILRPGDTLKLGHTMLLLDCSPDGLASRSKGIDVENDVMWAIRRTVEMGWRAVRAFFRGARRTFFGLFTGAPVVNLITAAIMLTYVLNRPFRHTVNAIFLTVYYRALGLFESLF